MQQACDRAGSSATVFGRRASIDEARVSRLDGSVLPRPKCALTGLSSMEEFEKDDWEKLSSCVFFLEDTILDRPARTSDDTR
jgi:hypothetical protein